MVKDKTEEPIQVIMDWFNPLANQAMAHKAKRMEANGAGKVSARDDDTVFLDYLAAQSDGASLFHCFHCPP